MANNANQSKTYRIYIKSTKEWVEVPEEFYREQTSYYDTFRKKAQYHGQCVCPKNKFWLCDGDCFNCEFRRAGDMLSLDYENENEDDDTCSPLDSVPDTAPLMADVVADKLLLEQLIQRLRELDPEADLILQMLGEEKSDRSIAEELGRPQRTFARQMQRYRNELRKMRGCGSWYGSKVWHSNSKYRKTIWQCNHKFDGDCRCQTPHLTDEEIQQHFLSAANKLLSTKAAVIANGREMQAFLFDTTELEVEQAQLLEETQVVSDMVQQAIQENAHTALNQTEYQKRYDSLVQRFDRAKTRLEEVTAEIQEKQTASANMGTFLNSFEQISDALTEFSLESWHSMVDYSTVYSADDIRFTFKNGQEIQA